MMLKVLNSHQIAEWLAYAETEPIGEVHGYYQGGIIASTIANVFSSKKSKIRTVTDFIPDFITGDTKDKVEPINVQKAKLISIFGKPKEEA